MLAQAREALYFSCIFTDNMTLFFMPTEPLYRRMNHMLVHNRKNTAPVSGGEGSTSQGGGQVTVGSGPRLLGQGVEEWETAKRAWSVLRETSTRGPGNEHRGGISTEAGLGGQMWLFQVKRPQRPLSSSVARGSTLCANSEPMALALALAE